MKLAIRADAFPAIGIGHLMRCLCIADVLRAKGHSIRFASRALPQHLQELIARRGHALTMLSLWETMPAGIWDADLQTRDANETAAALADAGELHWMIVDHYSLGPSWESGMRRLAPQIMVIDDLGRAHDCDVLLDQNFYRNAAQRYAGKVPAHCKVLLGPSHALLRPEFEQTARTVQPRDGDVRRILVFLGGMDTENWTGRVLNAIQALGRTDLALDVVIGQLHPARAAIESLCAAMPDAQCHVQTDRMPELFARADLAVGAGGGATWERCVLGVPTLALCIASNQREVLSEGSREGFVCVPDDATLSEEALTAHLRSLLANAGYRNLLSRKGMALVDGRGARRVAAELQNVGISMRRATSEDSPTIHAWRNDPGIRAVSRNSAEVTLAEHRRWFDATLRATDRDLLIGERDGEAMGVVRFDVTGDTAEVSIYLAPGRAGQGEGQALLESAERWLKSSRPQIKGVDAEVLAPNAASHRLFERCGYQPQSIRYHKRLFS